VKKFLDTDFLLQTETAKRLYHEHAKKMPIFDYHCHLSVKDIAEDRKFKNIAQLWLEGDHYKWRAMRANGIEEKYCTGNVSDWEKFYAWAQTVPYTAKNQLYHWTYLELKIFFGIEGRALNSETAREIYDHCNKVIKSESFCPSYIFKKMNIKVVCTTDDPTDTLEHHIRIKSDEKFPAKVYPCFRPDKGMAVENPALFNRWVDALAKASKINVKDYNSYIKALRSRHDFFHSAGCRISDHGIEKVYAEDFKQPEIPAIFKKVRSGKKPAAEEIEKFKTALMLKFGEWDSEKKWAMQLHIGAMRNTSTRMFGLFGPDSGYDSICDHAIAKPLAKFLDSLDKNNNLPKTILYSLNPTDNEVLATMAGNFQDGSMPGKMQFGSAWWFLDQKDGMEKQINTLSNTGLLSRFIGMLTDSRSFLSHPRHEYFRRILCNMLGNDIEKGELQNDMEFAGKMVEDICYNNAADYFNMKGRLA
jgi:glucuronate isomerase